MIHPLFFMVPALLAVQSPDEGRPKTVDLTVHAEYLHLAPGEVMRNALIQISDGKIAAVLPGRSAPEDALSVHSVMAGMIDASARVVTSAAAVEQSKEIISDLSVTDAIDLFSPAWARLARTGVTTTLVSPPDRNVVGGFSAVIKTAGPKRLKSRLVEGHPILRGAMGDAPSSGNSPAFGRPTNFFARRPTTRMGVEWEWRKAFFDAAQAARFPEAEFRGADVLRACLTGEVRLFIQAWTTADIRTAVYLDEEMQAEGYGNLDMVIDAGAEAWKEPAFLTRTGTPVVLPPFPATGRLGEQAFMPWDTGRKLIDAGVMIALSAHGGTKITDRLSAQAGYAMRGGLTFDEALACVTTIPAALLGVEKQVGSVKSGMDADLVLWNGAPFSATSNIVGVVVSGEIVFADR
jgi:imidazolonepropionase-like amidohydrolase